MIKFLLRPILLRLQTILFRRRYKSLTRVRANAAYDWLLEELRASDVAEEAQLRDNLTGAKKAFLKMLIEQPVACKVIERFIKETDEAMGAGKSDDMFIVYNRAAMFSMLAQLAEDCRIPKRFRRGFEAATTHSLRRFLNGAENQVDAFGACLRTVRDATHRLAHGGARILLLEMPIGNSLMVQCLANLLGPEIRAEIIRISLSRNDSKGRGFTRQELLREKLESAKVQSDDIVIYVDEWVSGVNFHLLCEQIVEVLPQGAYFLPVAILAPSAPSQARYLSFVADHDKLTKVWSGLMNNYRVLLPRLQTEVGVQGEFFWSEKDRLAGYRKLQVHGSIFSTLDATIELLHKDANKLNATLAAILARSTEIHALPASFARSVPVLHRIFEKGYADYQLCRDALRLSAEKYARGDRFADLESSVGEIVDGYFSVVGERPAKTAMGMAGFYMNEFGSLDPENRYLLRTHAPTIEILSGIAEVPHKVTFDHLLTRIRETG